MQVSLYKIGVVLLFGEDMGHQPLIEIHIGLAIETRQFQVFGKTFVHRFGILPDTVLWT